MTRLRRIFRRLIGIPYRRYAERRLRRSRRAVIRGCRFHTHPDDFHPTCFLSTPLFIDYLLKRSLSGKAFLDMGTGSGAVGVLAARAGAEVIACDINPCAVDLAGRNAKENGVEMPVRLSDLFAGLEPEKFDLICFNIPFYGKEAVTPLEQALNAGKGFEVVRRFAEEAKEYLAEEGRVVIIFSEDSGYERIISIFLGSGYRLADEQRRIKNLELFHITAFAGR